MFIIACMLRNDCKTYLCRKNILNHMLGVSPKYPVCSFPPRLELEPPNNPDHSDALKCNGAVHR